jgi:hypothetical protein
MNTDQNVFDRKGAWVGLDPDAEAALDPSAHGAYLALRDASAHAASAESLVDTLTKRVVELVAVGRDLEHQISILPRPSFMDTWKSDLQGSRR